MPGLHRSAARPFWKRKGQGIYPFGVASKPSTPGGIPLDIDRGGLPAFSHSNGNGSGGDIHIRQVDIAELPGPCAGIQQAQQDGFIAQAGSIVAFAGVSLGFNILEGDWLDRFLGQPGGFHFQNGVFPTGFHDVFKIQPTGKSAYRTKTAMDSTRIPFPFQGDQVAPEKIGVICLTWVTAWFSQ